MVTLPGTPFTAATKEFTYPEPLASRHVERSRRF
jgi:hypothetical protein